MFGHRLPISRRVRANFAISGRKIRPFIREPPSAGKRDDPHALPPPTASHATDFRSKKLANKRKRCCLDF